MLEKLILNYANLKKFFKYKSGILYIEQHSRSREGLMLSQIIKIPGNAGSKCSSGRKRNLGKLFIGATRIFFQNSWQNKEKGPAPTQQGRPFVPFFFLIEVTFLFLITLGPSPSNPALPLCAYSGYRVFICIL